MTGAILVVNAGSSSIKVELFAADDALASLMSGQIEAIGLAPRLSLRDAAGTTVADQAWPQGEGPRDHRAALAAIGAALARGAGDRRIVAIGHRVVHGGATRAAPVVIDPVIRAELAALTPLAPLHQPHNLAGIDAMAELHPGVMQVACFDTAFHRGHPWVADTFALPRAFHARGIRRYGFHGLSYAYVAMRLAEVAPEIAAGRVVVAHLGNGASMCALRGGRSIDSTMGFTALDGLPMGTRSGQIDPGVLLHLMTAEGYDAAALTRLLYHESGLKGLSGLSSDMRALEAAGTAAAQEAIAYFVYRIRRELGALAAVLGGLDALVFTAGIGENSPRIRAAVCDDMGWLGIALDATANAHGATVISAPESRVQVLRLATDEERMIAIETLRLLRG
ncbi:acetate/propionate family kinase [Elioraea sp.]|uniref:acetate/propionate family kinase n=1 Tax=Elioraea sp. TaxID=2185103 RepID=UPI0021DD3ABB|nr:acetate/propionate family kinase [Elioraea sp.]GIX11356.1 MAG: acetate kinase [Elioraea sp.]